MKRTRWRLVLFVGVMLVVASQSVHAASAKAGGPTGHKVWYTHTTIAPPGGWLGWLTGIPDASTEARAKAGSNPIAIDGPYTNDKVYGSWLTGTVSERNWNAEITDTNGGGSKGHGKAEFTGKGVDNLGVTVSGIAIGLVFGIEGKCEEWADAENTDNKTKAWGASYVTDPFHFAGLPEVYDPLLITSTLDEGMIFAAIEEGSSGDFHSQAWTDLPGLGILYSLDIAVSPAETSGQLSTLAVEFWSPTVLGLDNVAITDGIKRAFEYNENSGQWQLNSDYTYFSIELSTYPYSAFTLGFDDYARAGVGGVIPEPATLLLLSFGVVILRKRG